MHIFEKLLLNLGLSHKLLTKLREHDDLLQNRLDFEFMLVFQSDWIIKFTVQGHDKPSSMEN